MTGIIGLGTALPAHSVSQEESCSHAVKFFGGDERERLVLERLYRRTEIEQRGSVLAERVDEGRARASFFPPPDGPGDRGPTTAERMDYYSEHANALSLNACRAAIADAAVAPETITHLVTVSCTGFKAPGFDLNLIRELPLNRSVLRTHVGFMGCHGTLNALRVAQGFIRPGGGSKARVLVCATEICSVHFQYGRGPDDIVANSLFADGAASLVLSNESGRFSYRDSFSYVVENSDQAMIWRIGDNGFSMGLSPEVPRLIEHHLPSLLKNWLAGHDLRVADIASWAVHPGGPRILDAVERSLELPSRDLIASRDILSEHGNMSSPTVLFILERILQSQSGHQRSRCPCVILSFGPGLTIEAALLMPSE